MMHMIIGEGLHDADYIARYTTGFENWRARARISAGAGGRADGHPEGRHRELAREYATTRPAVIRLNYGVQRSERGGMAVRALRCCPR